MEYLHWIKVKKQPYMLKPDIIPIALLFDQTKYISTVDCERAF